MVTNSNTPPSSICISTTTEPNSDLTPSVDLSDHRPSTSRTTAVEMNSRRRITIQTAAPSQTSSPQPSTEVLQQIEEESTEIDPFDAVIEEFNRMDLEDADGGDSDVEGVESEVFDEAYVKAMIARNSHEGGLHVEEINSGEIAFVIAEDGVMDGVEDANLLEQILSKVPEDWSIPEKKGGDTEPDFETVDNPGNWNSFIFRPVYKKTGTGKNAKYSYVKHELPTGCRPVPLNKEGKREVNGWEFFYKGWESKKFKDARDGATPDNLFPQSRSSTLDLEILLNLGLTADRMRVPSDHRPDALWFLQLLLPMCDPSQSGIANDPRVPYYTEVTKFTNLYKYQTGIGTTYGHEIPEVSMAELVRWDGCLIRDGVKGGGDGAIYRRWHIGSAAYDPIIKKSMSVTRWNQIKRIFKLCNNDTAKKRGEDGYDPCYKYDMIYDAIVKNVIGITKNGELDLTGDETSWAFGGYGEKGGKAVHRFTKPGITKGGQTVIVSATNRVRPYWYQHRSAFTPRFGTGFSAEGPAEVRSCIDDLESLVVGRDGTRKKIFEKPPHLTFDNYFSGEEICNYAGEKGFGLLMTNRRDRLPKGIKSEYLHKQKTEANKRSKAARYIEPVILVKDCKDYEIVLTSFQSTSSCNIISVNSMSSNRNFVEARSRGRKNKKRIYVIEQNLARRLYLKSYSRIDSIDHLIKNCKIKYRSWKYWHPAANHAKALAVTTAYDLYLEVAEGKLHPSFKLNQPVDFFTFREKLSEQMCQYDPKEQLYHGDEKMRIVSKLNLVVRQKRKLELIDESGNGKLSFLQYKEIIQGTRICSTLSKYEKHLNMIKSHKSPAKCGVCGDPTYKRCNISKMPLHNMDTKGIGKGRNCALHWHSSSYLGLCFDDRKMFCVTAKEWNLWPWSTSQLSKNRRLIQGYERKIESQV